MFLVYMVIGVFLFFCVFCGVVYGTVMGMRRMEENDAKETDEEWRDKYRKKFYAKYGVYPKEDAIPKRPR